MRAERVFLGSVALTPPVHGLLADLASARARARKADPADRDDIVRFERLLTTLEALATAEMATHPGIELDVDLTTGIPAFLDPNPDTWPHLDTRLHAAARAIAAQGRLPVLLTYTFGPTRRTAPTRTALGVPDPLDHWEAPGLRGRAAVEKRFGDQVRAALAATGGAVPAPVSPNGVQNRVLTETLREYTNRDGHPLRLVPVEYRDGSRSAHPFAFRSLDLTDAIGPDPDLRFALLSIRHAELDAVVDGAWLRNSEISRLRQGGDTDDLVYDRSRAQFEALSLPDRCVTIELYQSGLEMAVVGFYKALVDHLRIRPGTIAVRPMYYAAGGAAKRPSARRSKKAQTRPTVAETAPFVKGTPWAM